MNWHDTHGIPKSAYLILPIMALAFYIAFIPHQGYPYLVHIDEWHHLAYSSAILEAGSITVTEPFLGQSIKSISSNLEAGFHLFWGVFHQISGISWLTIFKYFPGIVFMFTVLSVYVIAQRRGFGWEAALLTSLIPTTIGILGPGFLVPVALGLLFIALSLFLAFNFRSGWAYLVLFIFTSFLLSIHAPSAIGLVIVLIPYIVLNLKGNFKHSLGITIAVIIPFLVPFPWIFSMLLPTAKSLLVPQPLPTFVDFPQVIRAYGYLPVGLSLLGTFLLAIRGGKENYGLILGLLALLVMLVTFFTFHYGVSIIYERGLMYMMLMVGIIAGAGLAGVKYLSVPAWLTARLKMPVITQNVGKFLSLILVSLVLIVGIPDRQDVDYYHMIDEADYQAFVWIKENVDKDYGKAILDPWKGTAFAAITGRNVQTRIHTFPKPSDEKASKFLGEGSSDTVFLRKNEISIIYTREKVSNPDLIEVRKNIYLLKKGG